MANYPNWVNIDNGLGACSKRNRRTQKGEMEVEHSGVQSPEDPTWHSPFILPVRVRILVCVCVHRGVGYATTSVSPVTLSVIIIAASLPLQLCKFARANCL